MALINSKSLCHETDGGDLPTLLSGVEVATGHLFPGFPPPAAFLYSLQPIEKF